MKSAMKYVVSKLRTHWIQMYVAMVTTTNLLYGWCPVAVHGCYLRQASEALKVKTSLTNDKL